MSKFNKVITNVPVPLNETEVENLSQTLSGLLNGGGGEGKIYEGDGVYIDVDNTHITGKITLTQTAKTKLDTPIPTQVSDLTDSANYETTEHANATYLTQSSADTLYAPLSVSGDIEYLSGEFNNYYKKTETSSKEQLSDEFEKYQLKSDMEDYVTENTFYGAVEELENEKQNKLTFGYNSESAISSINGSALAGQETTTYDYGTDLIIDEYKTIQVNTNGTANNFGMSFVEGKDTKAAGVASHAEGKETSAMSDYSHTEGYKNIDYEIPGQIGSNHTEGAYNNVSGVYTHIEGHANGASGYGLHVQGGYNRFYINNTAADVSHSDPTDRWNIWGISIEGMANATTAEPYSGTIGQPDFGYIHGGILKVIGNGTRTKQTEDPSSESIVRSDALIIYRDGCISAAGNISANGIELGAGGGTSFTGVVIGTGLSGNGLSSSPLGIDTTAAIYFTNGSAESAYKAASASVSKRLQSSTSGPVIQAEDVTALQDWASSNSSTWDSVTANLISNKVFVSGTNFDTLGQSRLDGNDNCYGTNWMGVSQSHAGFLKYIDGQSVGDTEISNAGSGIQIEFKPNSTQGDLNIINTYTGTQTTTKVINVPTASYTNMSTFDSETGPNYMLRKTANGFDIGAAVINTTALPENVQANAYYFIYEM